MNFMYSKRNINKCRPVNVENIKSLTNEDKAVYSGLYPEYTHSWIIE